MTAWAIEPLTSVDDLDALLAVERASFSNPWTREMYLAELENEGVSFFYLARDATGIVVGFCSFWRILDDLHINNLAVAPERRRKGSGQPCSNEFCATGPVSTRGALPSKCADQTTRRSSCTSVSALRSRAPDGATTVIQRRMPSCCSATASAQASFDLSPGESAQTEPHGAQVALTEPRRILETPRCLC